MAGKAGEIAQGVAREQQVEIDQTNPTTIEQNMVEREIAVDRSRLPLKTDLHGLDQTLHDERQVWPAQPDSL